MAVRGRTTRSSTVQMPSPVCLRRNVSHITCRYRLVGGVNFYQRKEIKDILCYLKTIANGRDDLAVQRIINVPKRGIGAMSVARVNMFAMENDMSFYEALERVQAVPGMRKSGVKDRRV